MTVEIYRLESDVWVHASVGKNTALLRNRSDGEPNEEFDLQNDDRRAEFEKIRGQARRFTVAQVRAFLEESDSRHIELGTFKDRDQWLAAFEILGQLAADGYAFETVACTTSPSRDERGNRLIPQTSLRRFYQTLRMFDELAVTKSIATNLCNENRSEKLSTLIDDSVHHFRRYQNVGEPFHGRDSTQQRKVDNYVCNPSQFANCLQARLRSLSNQRKILNATDGTKVGYVDYEISPYRTTGRAALEDGKIGSSGSGGLDLLLVDLSGDQPIPIIGEIKAATDRDLFLALIQSLVYAVEIGSGTQLERLKTFYPNSFETLADGSQVDIYLLFEGETDDVKLFDESLKLVEQLFACNGDFCNLIRSVKFIKVKLGKRDRDVEFVVKKSVSLPLD